MIESLIRELYRFQDTLAEFVPSEIWQPWAENNEKLIWYLEEKYEKEEN